VTGLDGGDVSGDAMEQLIGGLDDGAVLADEIARAQHLERVIGERRRHVRTVRSAARSRNLPPRLVDVLRSVIGLPVRAPKRLIHRLEDLDRTSAFHRIAERHRQARVSRRLLALAVIVLLAVVATRVAAAAPAPQAAVVVAPSDCDPDLGCDDGGNDDGEVRDGEPADNGDGDDPGAPARELVAPGVLPRVVTRNAGRSSPCPCPHALPFAVAEVAAAAVRAAGLDHDPTHGWTTRARLAGLVPMFSARYGRNLTWKEVDDPTLGYTNMYDLRATWRLERLLFDPNEIRIAALDVSRRREKRRVEMLAVHSYLTWLRLPRANERAVLLAADLDAITDGWFSQALAKRGKL
jgi:hypothetical protein